MKTIIAGRNDDGRRTDAFLARLLPTAPKSLIYKYIRTGKVKVGGKKPRPETRICAGDEIRYFGDETLLSERAPAPSPSVGKITVLYEDEQLALLYKPPGLACQPDAVHKTDTLVDRFVAYLQKTGAYVPEEEHGFTPALCNRLDFNTQGIVIGAKTLPALREMNAQIRLGTVRKFYLCRVEGRPSPPEGVVRGRLAKDARTNISRISEAGKAAETHYKTLEAGEKTSLVEVELFSGRSHQIRVHMASLGCPLLGDAKYGSGGKGQALLAYKVQFAFSAKDALEGVAGKTFVLPRPYLEKI